MDAEIGMSQQAGMPDIEVATILERLEEQLPMWDRATCLHLLGALERLKAQVWLRIMESHRASDDRACELEADPLLTIPHVAKRLAISEGRAYELARQGKLPTLKVGKYVRVEPASLDAWIAQHRDRPLDAKLYTVYGSPRHDRKRPTKTAQAVGLDPARPGRAARRHGEHRGAVGTRRGPDQGADDTVDHAGAK